MSRIGQRFTGIAVLFVLISIAFQFLNVNIPQRTRYIAHAFGAVKGMTKTNSLEALEQNYKKGFRIFETDIESTTDKQFVLLHDWGIGKWYFFEQPGPKSLKEFKAFKMMKALTQMTVDDLAVWAGEHRDACFVTDVKQDNIEVLKRIRHQHPDIVAQIIPQIYKFEEYPVVYQLGYKNIILTLYKNNYSAEQIVDFANQNRLYAVTMSQDTAMTRLPRMLNDHGVFTYAHTINTHATRKKLLENGIQGFYTDYLEAGSF